MRIVRSGEWVPPRLVSCGFLLLALAFGISMPPSLLTVLGVCGVRLFWVAAVFPASPTFATIMTAYPVSLGITALLIAGALAFFRPAATAQTQR